MNRAQTFFPAALLALLAAAPASAQEEAPEKALDVSGVWEITAETPRGTMTRTVTFAQDGSSLTGTADSQMGSMPLKNGSVKGNKISFTLEFSRGDRTFKMKYTGTVDGDTAKGTFQTPRGDEIEWTGKRASET